MFKNALLACCGTLKVSFSWKLYHARALQPLSWDPWNSEIERSAILTKLGNYDISNFGLDADICSLWVKIVIFQKETDVFSWNSQCNETNSMIGAWVISQEDPSWLNWKIVDGKSRIETNKNISRIEQVSFILILTGTLNMSLNKSSKDNMPRLRYEPVTLSPRANALPCENCYNQTVYF